MGTKFSKRLVAVLIALVMVMASAMAVFAEGESSPGAGVVSPTISNQGTSDSYASKWFNFKWSSTNADYHLAFMREAGKAWKSVRLPGSSTAKKWSGLKDGGLYQFKAEAWNSKNKASSSISYRWMKTCKASAKAAKGGFTVKWNKVAGASKYQIQYSKNANMSGAKYAYPKAGATSMKISAGKGTWYWRIRPVRGSYIGIYNGIQKTTAK